MKRTAIAALAGLSMTCAAQAQSSVSLYGSIDEGITYNTNAKGSGAALVGPVAVPD